MAAQRSPDLIIGDISECMDEAHRRAQQRAWEALMRAMRELHLEADQAFKQGDVIEHRTGSMAANEIMGLAQEIINHKGKR